MFRSLISVSLCATLTIAPCFGQVSVIKAAPSTRRLPDGMFYAKDDQGRPFLTSVSTLEQVASSGKPYSPTSAYHLGLGYETGEATPSRQPDYALASHWYGLAAKGGSVKGIYRAGVLYSLGKTYYPDAKGVMRPAPGIGKQLMQMALAHGYKPSTDIVNGPAILSQAQTQREFASMNAETAQPTQNPSAHPASSRPSDPLTAGDIFAGMLAVGVAAAVLSGASTSNTSDTKSRDNSNDGGAQSKSCWIDTSHSVSDSSPSGSHWETSGHTGYGYACP